MTTPLIVTLAVMALLAVLGGTVMVCYLSASAAQRGITFLLQDSPQENQAKAQQAQRIAALLAEAEQVQRDLQKAINASK